MKKPMAFHWFIHVMKKMRNVFMKIIKSRTKKVRLFFAFMETFIKCGRDAPKGVKRILKIRPCFF